MNQRYKIAKPVYRFDHCVRNGYTVRREAKLSNDDEHKPYVRGPRKMSSLPNTYDTQWIVKCKSWKHRCRKRKQWIRHIICDIEKYVLGWITWDDVYKRK